MGDTGLWPLGLAAGTGGGIGGTGGMMTGEWELDPAPKNEEDAVEYVESRVFRPDFRWGPETEPPRISFHPGLSPDASVPWEIGRKSGGTDSVRSLFHASTDPDTEVG